jgi:hypothetical protein
MPRSLRFPNAPVSPVPITPGPSPRARRARSLAGGRTDSHHRTSPLRIALRLTSPCRRCRPNALAWTGGAMLRTRSSRTWKPRSTSSRSVGRRLSIISNRGCVGRRKNAPRRRIDDACFDAFLRRRWRSFAAVSTQEYAATGREEGAGEPALELDLLMINLNTLDVLRIGQDQESVEAPGGSRLPRHAATEKALTERARDGIYLRRCNNGKEVIQCLTLRWRVAQVRRTRSWSRPSGSADAAGNSKPTKPA